ncbi:S-adenosyl-L-methionine-dependent methyltransferase [Flammula alnicola]|nr:S-adenosyl-L-methionine-dependent methyltransferase [Flammula alnicola]
MTAPTNGLPNGTIEVTMLADLIVASVQEVVKEYQTSGYAVPSLHSTEPGPFDAPHLVSARLAKAIQTIEAACAQLSFTVANPGHVIANKVYGYEEPACMLVVTNAKIADMLLGKPDGLPVDELAKRSGLDVGKLGRILRMLATKHCFEEVKPDVFANNRLSMQLVSTNPVAGLVGHMADEAFKAGAFLNETLTDPKTASSALPDDTPFQRVHGASLFGFYDTPIGEKVRDRFAQAMVGWGEVTGRSMLPKIYPWDKVPTDATICDIGGGNGHATLGVIKAFPHLKVVLQDTPAVVQQGKDYWSAEYPDAVQKQRINFVPIDFFADQPVPNGDFYYLRHVLHDWPTAESLKILGNIRKVMSPSSRLLIHELVLQHAVRDPSGSIEQAPEPLLANYGMGRLRLYQQDLNMMILLNAKERTLQEFIELGEKSGFKFEKLWDSGEVGLVEFSAA